MDIENSHLTDVIIELLEDKTEYNFCLAKFLDIEVIIISKGKYRGYTQASKLKQKEEIQNNLKIGFK